MNGPRLRTDDGLELQLYEWPVETPRATLALLHGYAEHAGRYEHVASSLNQHGISAFAIDLRGHGRSTGRRGFVRRFQEYHLDVELLVRAATVRAARTPVALFGHSLGALIACHWLVCSRKSAPMGLVLSSPFLGLARALSPMTVFLVRLASVLTPTLRLPARLSGARVARDQRIARDYDEDPLVNRRAPARWVTEALRAAGRVQEGAAGIELPTLLLYGSEDLVASVPATERFAARLGAADKTCERLEGAYHEIVNEPEPTRARVLRRIGEWVVDRASSRASGQTAGFQEGGA